MDSLPRAVRQDPWALLGDIVFTPDMDHFEAHPASYLVCRGDKVEGIYPSLPESLRHIQVKDYLGRLIIPGLCDTHVHAPQYAFRGLGMDLELLDWLNAHTFPEETRYADLAYADRAYRKFADAMRSGATTRAAIFATTHVPATMLLMRRMEETGLICRVGKVSMNRNAPDALLDGPDALHATEAWVTNSLHAFERTRPIITPRFAISCTKEMLIGLGKIARKYGLPVQSHLSENHGEIEWVKQLCPWADSYSDAYEIFDLFGGGIPTVMAHCVHSGDYERRWIKSRGVLISHCPASNANLSSGIAPIQEYIDGGLSVSLGSDIAGGCDLSIFRAMADAITVSKLRACQTGGRHISVSQAFYMGTKGACPLFGRVGSFEPGYAFDAVVLHDARLTSLNPLTVPQRAERCISLDREITLEAKYAGGLCVFERGS